MKPFFSIIMPVYNAEKYVASAIESVLSQTFQSYELLLIDDGSLDKSGKICKQYVDDDRVKFFTKKNGGVGSARNYGMSVAQGKYIGFIDCDDLYSQNMLSDCYKILEKEKPEWIKFGKTEVMMHGEKILKTQSTSFEDRIILRSELLSELLGLRNAGVMTFVWDSFILKDTIEKSGIVFDETFKYGNEDIDFCEQFINYVDKLVICSDCYYTHYTRLGVSTSSKYSEDKISSFLYLMKKSNERYHQYNISIIEDKINYVSLVTKTVVMNICRDLNNVNSDMKIDEKIIKLAQIKNSLELEEYVNLDKCIGYIRPFKVWMYHYLFVKEHYRLLLWVDRCSRKVIYFIREKTSMLNDYNAGICYRSCLGKKKESMIDEK